MRSCSLEYFRFICSPTFHHFCKRESTQVSRIHSMHKECILCIKQSAIVSFQRTSYHFSDNGQTQCNNVQCAPCAKGNIMVYEPGSSTCCAVCMPPGVSFNQFPHDSFLYFFVVFTCVFSPCELLPTGHYGSNNTPIAPLDNTQQWSNQLLLFSLGGVLLLLLLLTLITLVYYWKCYRGRSKKRHSCTDANNSTRSSVRRSKVRRNCFQVVFHDIPSVAASCLHTRSATTALRRRTIRSLLLSQYVRSKRYHFTTHSKCKTHLFFQLITPQTLTSTHITPFSKRLHLLVNMCRRLPDAVHSSKCAVSFRLLETRTKPK